MEEPVHGYLDWFQRFLSCSDTVSHSQFSWISHDIDVKILWLGRGIHQELTSVEWFEKYLSRYLRNRYIDTWLLFLGTEPCIDSDIYLFLERGSWYCIIFFWRYRIFWIRKEYIFYNNKWFFLEITENYISYLDLVWRYAMFLFKTDQGVRWLTVNILFDYEKYNRFILLSLFIESIGTLRVYTIPQW